MPGKDIDALLSAMREQAQLDRQKILAENQVKIEEIRADAESQVLANVTRR